MKGNGSLLKKMFLLSVGSIVIFILIWAYYFHRRLVPLGPQATEIYYREILPGLAVQGFVFALILRIFYTKTLGKRVKLLLNYLETCTGGDPDELSEADLRNGKDEISRAGEQVNVLLHFLTSTSKLMQEKINYFKSVILNLMNNAGKTDHGMAETSKYLQECGETITLALRAINAFEDDVINALAPKPSGKTTAIVQQARRLLETVESAEDVVNGEKNVNLSAKGQLFEKIEGIEELACDLMSVKEIEEETTQLCEELIAMRKTTEDIFQRNELCFEKMKSLLSGFSEDKEEYRICLKMAENYLFLVEQVSKTFNEIKGQVKNTARLIGKAGECMTPLQGISLRGDADRLLQAAVNLEDVFQQSRTTGAVKKIELTD